MHLFELKPKRFNNITVRSPTTTTKHAATKNTPLPPSHGAPYFRFRTSMLLLSKNESAVAGFHALCYFNFSKWDLQRWDVWCFDSCINVDVTCMTMSASKF